MKIISWERIRMVLREEDKKQTTDNMFRLEAIAQAQLGSCEKEHRAVLREILGEIEDRESVAQPDKDRFFTIFRDDWQALKQKYEAK